MTKAYKIENLDVYRKAIQLGTKLYGLKRGADQSAAHDKLKEKSLEIVLELASGLGFWEKEFKVDHFRKCKAALLGTMPLLELMKALQEIDANTADTMAEDVQSLTKSVNDLLRHAQRKED